MRSSEQGIKGFKLIPFAKNQFSTILLSKPWIETILKSWIVQAFEVQWALKVPPCVEAVWLSMLLVYIKTYIA